MKVIYDRRIQNDLRAAISYYDTEGGPALGDRFFAEAEHAIARVIARPKVFHFAAPGLRRVALRSFPYHFLYEVKSGAIPPSVCGGVDVGPATAPGPGGTTRW